MSLKVLQKLRSKQSDSRTVLPAPDCPGPETAAIERVPAKRTTFVDPNEGTPYRQIWKRMIDVTVSSIGLLTLGPVLLIVGIFIKSTSPGPLFFLQDRVGQDGKRFRIVKFRSMVRDAEKKGPGITSSGDCRVTPVGVILRKFKIDELPQLWNVMVGEMSLVGPRPELPCYVAKYTREQRRVLSVRPGITDLASIQYRHEEQTLAQSNDPEELYCNVILPHKLDLNLEYIEKMSFLFDAKLILQTLKSLFV